MTLVPLTYKNFVKNKVKNTIKTTYKESESETYVYDNNLDSKSILNTNNYDNIKIEEVGLSNNDNEELDSINEFFNVVNTVETFKDPDQFNENYFDFKDNLFSSSVITNGNLKSFNFRNKYKIERVEQRFLPQSFELQKKNYVKNNLYKEYQKNYSLYYYNNLEHGFCNWNTINFFSQRFEEDRNHTNCIIWPNTKVKNSSNIYDKNQYSFVNDNSFNLSFYFNLRKNYSESDKPECVFHVPDLISIYIIKCYNLNSHKIAVSLGNSSKSKLKNITNYNSNTNNEQYLADNSVYVSTDLNILNNRWYNLSLNFNKNADNARNIEFYLDGVLKFNIDMTIDRLSNITNSYICIGNKPDYQNDSLYEHIFYEIFARNFDKDISLGKDNNWQAIDDELLDTTQSSYKGSITFEKSTILDSESFHGEIHDIRIYNIDLEKEKIEINCKNVVENLQDEIKNYNLDFYIPVHYVPTFTHKKESFNCSQDKVNLKYACLYNPVFANTCGGLNVSVESYLVDFVKHTKPNVVIGGDQESYIYNDNLANSVSSLTSTTDSNDLLKMKTGVFSQTIYNDNLIDSTHINRNINLDSNLSYRNLFILPNDNGIQKVNFNSIKSFLEDYNNEKYEANQIDETKLFNIDINSIFSKNYLNRSWDNFINKFDQPPNTEIELQDASVIVNSEKETFSSSKDSIFLVSNIIYHDERINNMSTFYQNYQNVLTYGEQSEERFIYSSIESVRSNYIFTESNPALRNYKERLSDTLINSNHIETAVSLEYKEEDINYLKLPIPYSVFNLDYDSMFSIIFDISNKLYNSKIKKNTFSIKDNNLITTNDNIKLSFKDNTKGMLYRSDCLTEVADWNYVGHVFYKDGIVSLNRPELFYFGKNDFECEFESDFMMYVHEINIPADKGLFDVSSNLTYDSDLRQDESAFNSEESFVYITDINLHDENLNIVAKAKLARPAPKKKSDSILFRLKMDY